jgi:methanogenic corrinoid protein MtbC1
MTTRSIHRDIRSRDHISKLVHGIIVPDLLSSLEGKSPQTKQIPQSANPYAFHQSDIVQLSKILVDGDMSDAEDIVSGFLKSGCSARELITGLLSDTSRYLGQQWCEDRMSFAEVTLGTMGVHSLLRSVDVHLTKEILPQANTGSILLSPVPGDTHIFALAVLESFLRAAGWKVEALLDSSVKLILSTVENKHVDVFGLSVPSREHISSSKNLIKQIRKRSRNADIKVMVGGPAILDDISLVFVIGADGMARDASHAVETLPTICNQTNPVNNPELQV